MTAAHLRAVPDPDDETSGPGDWPVPVPAVVAPRPAPDDEEKPPTTDDGEKDLADEDERKRGWMPDLRPYYDPRPLAELGPIAIQIGKNGGPPLFRAIGAGLCHLGRGVGALLVLLGRRVGALLVILSRGLGVLLVLLAGYLSGNLGKRGSVGARFVAAGFAAYAAVKLSMEYPAFPWFVLAALLTAVILAGLGHVQVPGSKPAKSGTAKKKGEGEKDKKDAPKSNPARAQQDAEADAGEEAPDTAEVSKPEAPASLRPGLLSRFRRHAGVPAEQSPADPEKAPDQNDDQVPGPAGDEAAESPCGPSSEEVIRALHHLYRGGSGVLHTALVQHLGLADTRAAKRVLDEAGIRYRPGVRTPAGNGPGVHRDDIPPLPIAQESSQGADVVAGQPANANANNAANAPGEGLEAHGDWWTAEELEQGFRFVRDIERGPTSWKIEYREES